MRRRLAVLLAAAVVTGPLVVSATAQPGLGLVDVTGLTAAVEGRAVGLDWSPLDSDRDLQVLRDDAVVATLPAGSTSYDDAAVRPGRTYAYRVAVRKPGKPGKPKATPRPVPVTLPEYLVGAANRDISPAGVVNVGGFGVGDGTAIPDALVGRGGTARTEGDRVRTRAMVVDDGQTAIAIANIEVTGHFAAYEEGEWGLEDMAKRVAAANPRLPLGNILIASDHTHSGPDTLGVWGGPTPEYLDFLRDSVVAAIEEAYAERQFAALRAGESDASDLIYNQSCTEALNQSKEPAYPGPEVCATPGKDGMFRVVQATAPSGEKVVTWATYAAHATAGGGSGLHGDWPQFLSDLMSKEFGGEGLAMVGALGGTQPCRPTCSFTSPSNPGYDIADRRTALMANYSRHVRLALAAAEPVSGPVGAQRGYIREAITGPAVTALFTAGHYAGAELIRSKQPPWVNAQTIRTVVGAMRIGDLAVIGTPGEGFPRIGQDVRDAVGDERMVIQLGLAGDMLGYLIAPAEYVPIIAAEVPVNDNIIFNVSPTIGDHVACADLRLVLALGFSGASPADCLAYDLVDATGDPIGGLPVGGVTAP
ncbi:MAG: Alkaline ceramidase domain protein [Frankiales bacterium]|nr:Alkaline ceramidase domain protein [Frankiales bacterium]